jgi:hypothetical protein
MRRSSGVAFCSIAHAAPARLPQIPVPPLEGIEHVAQLLFGSLGIETKHSANNIIGPNLIGGVEISRFCCRFERSNENPCWIRAQIQALAINESELGQRGFLHLLEAASRD